MSSAWAKPDSTVVKGALSNQMWYMAVNIRIFKDVRVRQAVNHAINRRP